MGVGVDIIEPLGFIWNSSKLRRAGMDYIDHCDIRFYPDWQQFLQSNPHANLLALTPYASQPYWEHQFTANDYLVVGQESVGLPEVIMDQDCKTRLLIPMLPGRRSLNLAIATAMVVGEAVRQRLQGSSA